MLLQDIECRIAHRAMAMTPDFIKECFFVPDQFHHPPHIRILFITSEKFQFPVACNEMCIRDSTSDGYEANPASHFLRNSAAF